MHNRSGRPFATLATVNNQPNLQCRRLPPSITHRQHHRQQRQRQAGQSARSHHLPAQCQCAQQRTQPQLPSEEPCDGPNSPTTTSPAAPASSGMLAALLIGCVAMVLAAVHRAAFAVLAVPIQQDLALSPPQMGKLQCALLLGYLCGQVMSGACEMDGLFKGHASTALADSWLRTHHLAVHIQCPLRSLLACWRIALGAIC